MTSTVKISALTAGSSPSGAEAFPAVQGTATVKLTLSQVKTFAQGGLAAVATSGSAADLSSGALPAARLNGMGVVTGALVGNVSLNNTGSYFDGPSVAQGSSGTWFVSGTVTVNDASGTDTIVAKLWDGTTVIACTQTNLAATPSARSMTLCGYITSPAGNLRISCKDISSTGGAILAAAPADSTANASTLTAVRIG